MTDIDYVYPDQSRVHGWDISHWAGGVVDFQKARDVAKAAFVFIKATNGINEVNWFRENWEASKGYMLRGAYHWLYPSWVTSANGQARKLHALLTEVGDFGELPIVVDFEKTYHNYEPAFPTVSDLWGFVATWEDMTGKKPIIYTGPSFWQTYGGLATTWKEYPLWIANYERETPTVPAPWTEYTFWQFSEKGFGENYGVDKYQKRAVDLNYFGGTAQEFQELFGDTIPPIVEPPGEPMDYAGKVLLRAKYRPVASTNNVALGVLEAGTSVKIDEVKIIVSGENVWCHIVEPVVGWMASLYPGYNKILDYWEVGQPSGELPDIPVKVVLGDNITYYQQEFTATLKPVK